MICCGSGGTAQHPEREDVLHGKEPNDLCRGNAQKDNAMREHERAAQVRKQRCAFFLLFGLGNVSEESLFCLPDDVVRSSLITESSCSGGHAGLELLTTNTNTESRAGLCVAAGARWMACFFCGNKAAPNLCGRCLEARYCSKICQTAHWKQHKRKCTARALDGRAAAEGSSSGTCACPECNNPRSQCTCDDPPTCWICLESEGNLLRACACRGSSGYLHINCATQVSCRSFFGINSAHEFRFGIPFCMVGERTPPGRKRRPNL